MSIGEFRFVLEYDLCRRIGDIWVNYMIIYDRGVDDSFF